MKLQSDIGHILWDLSKQKLICSAKMSERQMRTCNRTRSCTRNHTHNCTRNRNATRSLGARLVCGYTASKCKRLLQYPIMKRILAASASEQPVKWRKVKHKTYKKWVRQYDRECQTVTWLDCKTGIEGDVNKDWDGAALRGSKMRS